ncbi:hypothetical protein Cni_G17176 [Canna indica]|uniref:Reverse transcriptase domain-containing protein n=1 Tax=Canna indica TaxID=4628 RepID=A0AAQ3KK78_9LILI|nr:hypothetical protein Cni_G17176 [Canna indica]
MEGVNFSVKVNGEQSRSFRSFKGLRQGDPLSPYLFIVMEQLFTNMLNTAVDKRKIVPFKQNEISLSHILFADDMVLFVKGSKNSCKNLKRLVDKYCRWTGQKVNKSKSEIFFPGKCDAAYKHKICQYLDIKEGKYPMKYLGTYLAPKRLENKYQMKLANKVKGKFQYWAKNQITQAGKAVLLNSVISSIPVHTLLSSWVSDKVINSIEKMEKDFFWATSNERHSAKLISWRKVTDSRSNGGLGIRNIHVMKQALVAKRVLPVLNKDDVLWVKFLNAKYKNMHPWLETESKGISWNIKALISGMVAVREGPRMVIGDGKVASVWNDPWFSEIPLRWWPTYANVNELAKYETVSELFREGKWNMDLLSQCFDLSLCRRIEDIWIDTEHRNEKWAWSKNDTGALTTKRAYPFIKGMDDRTEAICFDWSKMWRLKMSERIKKFIWKLIWGRVPTSKWFGRFTGAEIEKCFVCKDAEDDINHLLFECEVASRYWSMAESRLGIVFKKRDEWTNGGWMNEAEAFDSDSDKKLCVFIANSLWLIWKNRNLLKYEGKGYSLNAIFINAFNETLSYNREATNLKDKVAMRPGVINETDGYLDTGTLTMFCDAAWKDSSESGVGCVLTELGNWKCLSMRKLMTESPLKAEFISIWFGLDNARKKGIKEMLVASDCLRAIKVLRGDFEVPWNLVNLVNKILMLSKDVRVKNWVHVNRKKNVIAHSAPKAAMCDGLEGTWVCVSSKMGGLEDVIAQCNSCFTDFINKISSEGAGTWE